MNKLAFWVMIFIGLMLCFLKYEIDSFVDIEKQYLVIINFGLYLIAFTIAIYGTPNGFIKGFKNMKKDNSANK